MPANAPVPMQQRRKLLLHIATALSACHSLGLVHRDLKPANILMLDNCPYIADMGLARTLHVPLRQLTHQVSAQKAIASSALIQAQGPVPIAAGAFLQIRTHTATHRCKHCGIELLKCS